MEQTVGGFFIATKKDTTKIEMFSLLQNVEQYSKIAAINSELSVRMQAKQLAF